MGNLYFQAKSHSLAKRLDIATVAKLMAMEGVSEGESQKAARAETLLRTLVEAGELKASPTDNPGSRDLGRPHHFYMPMFSGARRTPTPAPAVQRNPPTPIVHRYMDGQAILDIAAPDLAECLASHPDVFEPYCSKALHLWLEAHTPRPASLPPASAPTDKAAGTVTREVLEAKWEFWDDSAQKTRSFKNSLAKVMDLLHDDHVYPRRNTYDLEQLKRAALRARPNPLTLRRIATGRKGTEAENQPSGASWPR